MNANNNNANDLNNAHGNLCDYHTTEILRPATAEERERSDNEPSGVGVIEVDGRACCVE